MDNKTIEYKLHTILQFGKHRHKTVKEIIQEDPTYIYWMYNNGFKLTLEVRRASNERTKERKKAHISAQVQAQNNVRTYTSALQMTESGEIISGHEQGLRDIRRHLDAHMMDKHPEIFDHNEYDY